MTVRVTEEENWSILKKKPEAAENRDAPQSRKMFHSLWAVSGDKKILLLLMLCGMVFVFSGTSLLAPFFPREAAKKGATPTLTGLIIASYALVMLITAPIFGKHMATIGSRFMLVSSILVIGVSTALFGVVIFCTPGSVFIALCFLLRITMSLGSTAFLTSSFSLGPSSFPDNAAIVASSLESAYSTGSLIGPSLGGLLFQAGGYFFPFVTIGGIITLCGLIMCAVMPKVEEARPEQPGSFASLSRSGAVCLASYIMVCMGFSFTFFAPTLAIHLQEFRLRTSLVGAIFAVCPVTYMLLIPLGGWMADKGYYKQMLTIGCVLSSIGIQLLGPSPLLFSKNTLWAIVLGLVIIGSSLAICQPASFVFFIKGAESVGIGSDNNVYGLMSGVYTSAFAVGMFCGPSLGGVTVQYLGYQISCFLCSLPVLLAAILMTVYTTSSSACVRDAENKT